VRFAPDGAFFNLETSNAAKKKAGHSTRDPSSDPLALVAARIVSESPLVCFDEVELSDIADALVFKRVFEKVFERGGALVATSNAAPEALYDGGINRAAFAPFAKELERRTRVVSLDAPGNGQARHADVEGASAAVAEPERGLDHRRVNRAGEAARRAPTAGREPGFGEDSRGDDERRRFADEGASPPPSVAAGARSVLVVAGETDASSRSEAQSDAMDGAMDVLLETWRAATTGTETRDVSIRVAAGRSLRVPAARGRGCRFSFRDLFGQEARLGVADYAALLARYDVVCVDTVVPTFAAEKDEDALRRFVNFVDVAYENKTLLVAATARAPEDLLVTDRSDGDDQSDDQSDEASPIDSTHSFSTRARVRLEGTRGAFALAESGGASGRSAPMVGDMEWSATGRGGAALADLQATNFTFRAAARCVSRLVEMGGEAYEAAWWEQERARRRLERGSGDEAR
jgi:predicted ATPase